MFNNIIRLVLACSLILGAVGAGPAASAQSGAAATAGSAGPDDAAMGDFFKGSLIVTLPAFKTYRVSRQFFADHTFADVEKRKIARGTWTLEGDRICTQRPTFQRYCNLGLGRKIGESWQDKDPYTGNEVDFALIAERKPLP